MKAVALKSQNTGVGVKPIPAALAEKLSGYTMNSAIKAGLITDIGDDTGAFIKKHADPNVDAAYAIVNGFGIRVSGKVADAPNILDILGDLTFTKGMSLEKYKDGQVDPTGSLVPWYRLGLPQVLNLGDTIAEVAVATDVVA